MDKLLHTGTLAQLERIHNIQCWNRRYFGVLVTPDERIIFRTGIDTPDAERLPSLVGQKVTLDIRYRYGKPTAVTFSVPEPQAN